MKPSHLQSPSKSRPTPQNLPLSQRFARSSWNMRLNTIQFTNWKINWSPSNSRREAEAKMTEMSAKVSTFCRKLIARLMFHMWVTSINYPDPVLSFNFFFFFRLSLLVFKPYSTSFPKQSINILRFARKLCLLCLIFFKVSSVVVFYKWQ